MYPCNAGIRPNVAVDKSFRSNRDSCSDGNRRGYRHQESSVKLGEGGKLQRSKFWTLARIGFVSNSFTASLDFFFFKIFISSKNKGYRATRDLQDLYTLPQIDSRLKKKVYVTCLSQIFTVVKSVPPTDFHQTMRNLVLHPGRANGYRERKKRNIP